MNTSPMKIAESKEMSLNNTAHYQFRYAILGLLAGVLCIVGGFFLCLCGVTGGTKGWNASLFGFHSSATDIPAGSLMVFAGVFIIFITRLVIPRPRNKKQ